MVNMVPFCKKVMGLFIPAAYALQINLPLKNGMLWQLKWILLWHSSIV